jgi:hypothetical protein
MVCGEMSSDGFLTQVIIVGDLSKEDVDQAGAQSMIFLQYGGITSDTTTMVYNNDTVYFAQPSLSQFIPGGVGAGTTLSDGRLRT